MTVALLVIYVASLFAVPFLLGAAITWGDRGPDGSVGDLLADQPVEVLSREWIA